MELAERFGVSRSPIREAVRALDAVGLVEVLPNRGAYVRRIELAEALEVYEVRAALFGQAGRLMAQRGTAEDRRAGCASLHDEMAVAAEAHHFEELCAAQFRLPRADRRCRRQPDAGRAIPHAGQAAAAVPARNLMFGDTLAHSHREHDAIVRAIEARDAEAAARACFAHVEEGRKRVC